MKPKPHQLNKIKAEQKNDQKQDVMEFEDRAYLNARGVTKAKQQLDESELQIKLEQIMLERSMEKMRRSPSRRRRSPWTLK